MLNKWKQKITKFVCFALTCQLFILTAWAKPDWPSDTGIMAEAGIVMDMDSGAILYGQNIHLTYPPASITKILTALIVLENCSLDDTVTFSTTAVNQVEADSGNKISVVAGDQLSVEDCLYSLLLVSCNQAANALAEHTAGSISAFVDMMNEKLVELGCQESHFENPSGLNGDNQYVSAYDMALIAQAAYDNETMVEISSATTHKIAPTTQNPDGFTIRGEHRLCVTEDQSSPYYYPEAIAGKTGYLIKAGNTLVTYAVKDNRRLVSVILKGQPRQYFVDGKALLEFGFRSFQNYTVADYESRYVTGNETINLDKGSFQVSDLMIDPDSVITLPNGASFEDADISLGALPEVSPDNAVALLTYTYNDRVIGTAYLLVKDGVTIDNGDGSTGASATTGDGSTNASGSADTANSSLATSSNATDSQRTHRSFSIAGVLVTILIVLLVLAVIGIAGWIIYSRKKEAKALAERRKRRRQRLQRSGDQEEFERLLEEYKNKKK
ncbi:D-alanyl-D-alanine carboxypeptidase family protein [Clostridium sp. OF09-36]|uniref:D-alanyl-D-alanine carboxypeptidase family protein n=1 Tax=Clostridium sp. OF09-36 TaxID=2292310 RepID=UPI001FA94255|nr:D-alanyl-D-alanine carboxypeptidase family protein [Clostridium sp. OF09-36]